jgi:hypothetical protein
MKTQTAFERAIAAIAKYGGVYEQERIILLLFVAIVVVASIPKR